MLHITSLEESLDLFKALGSEVRVQILNILLNEKNISMNQLATRLNISNGALTAHVKKLEEAGLIAVTGPTSEGHGNQKVYSILVDRVLVDIERPTDYDNVYDTQIRVGQYSSHNILPTCGIANSEAVIGQIDDPRYFDHPDRFSADIVWLTKGYVEYTVPNIIPSLQSISRISVSAELSSEAPGVDSNWPSDISFYINDILLGKWTCPGDFGDVRGLFNPGWWPSVWNQYGLLKLLVVDRGGTFVDGARISDVTSTDLALDSTSNIRLRIGVDEDSEHVGGLTIFGKSFGNYNQDINVSLFYRPLAT